MFIFNKYSKCTLMTTKLNYLSTYRKFHQVEIIKSSITNQRFCITYVKLWNVFQVQRQKRLHHFHTLHHNTNLVLLSGVLKIIYLKDLLQISLNSITLCSVYSDWFLCALDLHVFIFSVPRDFICAASLLLLFSAAISHFIITAKQMLMSMSNINL